MSAQRDQPLNFSPLIGFTVSPEVEVRLVFVVKVETSAGCSPGHQERRVLRVPLIAERRRPECTSPVNLRHLHHYRSESQHARHSHMLTSGWATPAMPRKVKLGRARGWASLGCKTSDHGCPTDRRRLGAGSLVGSRAGGHL